MTILGEGNWNVTLGDAGLEINRRRSNRSGGLRRAFHLEPCSHNDDVCFLVFTNSAPFLNCDEISTQKDLRACAGGIDVHFMECAEKGENSGDFRGLAEQAA